MSETYAGLQLALNDTNGQLDNARLQKLTDTVFNGVQLLSRTAVSLTAVATTTLYTVPTGKKLIVFDICLEGRTSQSGGTGSILKVGKSGALNLINSTTGHTFTSATATTLLPATYRRSMNSLYPLSNMNGSTVTTFAAGDVIIADVTASTAVVTAGNVFVEVWGVLIDA